MAGFTARDVQVEVDASDALHGLQVKEEHARSELRAYMEELGLYAWESMMLYVRGRQRLEAVVDRTGVRRDPVTGNLEESMGARQPFRWTLYHHGGTGVYATPPRDPITARADRFPATVVPTRRPRLAGGKGFLRFVGRGGRIYFRRSVLGQDPNPFVERGWRLASIYANATHGELGRRIAT